MSNFIRQTNIFPTDSFELLELQIGATIEDVKKSFKSLAQIHHPDKGGDAEKFIQITTAKNKCIHFLENQNQK